MWMYVCLIVAFACNVLMPETLKLCMVKEQSVPKLIIEGLLIWNDKVLICIKDEQFWNLYSNYVYKTKTATGYQLRVLDRIMTIHTWIDLIDSSRKSLMIDNHQNVNNNLLQWCCTPITRHVYSILVHHEFMFNTPQWKSFSCGYTKHQLNKNAWY